MHKELNRSGFYYGFPVFLATTKDQKGRDDTEHPQRHANAADLHAVCKVFGVCRFYSLFLR